MAEAKVAGSKEPEQASVVDPCSFANIDEVKPSHTHLNLSVNFEKHILSGKEAFVSIAAADLRT